jgi:trehalose 6-phosphate phosphatase
MHNLSDLASPPPVSELAARGAIALFLDFDGTLVDIADTPGAIHIPSDLARRLDRLNQQFGGRLALISGRSIADIGHHLGATQVTVIGSHGAEFDDIPVSAQTLSDDARSAIAALTRRWPNLLVETKPHGIAIHYRQEPDAASIVLSVMTDIAEREGLAAKQGKMVVELGPQGANKGQAVARLMTQPPYAGATPIFIGDDVTDEDGFAAAAAAGGFGILVGPTRATAAQYRFVDPPEVYQWLNL